LSHSKTLFFLLKLRILAPVVVWGSHNSSTLGHSLE